LRFMNDWTPSMPNIQERHHEKPPGEDAPPGAFAMGMGMI